MKHTLREYLYTLQVVTRRNAALSSLIFALLVLIALMLFKSDTEPAVLKEKARRVSTLVVKTANLSPSLPLYVRVTTPNRAGLRASVTADVAELNVLEGDTVRRFWIGSHDDYERFFS